MVGYFYFISSFFFTLEPILKFNCWLIYKILILIGQGFMTPSYLNNKDKSYKAYKSSIDLKSRQ